MSRQKEKSQAQMPYNNLILIDNVVQTRDDETNNILCTTRHTGHT